MKLAKVRSIYWLRSSQSIDLVISKFRFQTLEVNFRDNLIHRKLVPT